MLNRIFSLGFIGASLLVASGAFADEFPSFDSLVMERDRNVTDEQLFSGTLEPEVAARVDQSGVKFYALDYSTLVRGVSLEKLRNAIADYEYYKCYMSQVKSGQIKDPAIQDSHTDVETWSARKANPSLVPIPAIDKALTVHFETQLIKTWVYYLDIYTKANSDTRFGTAWMINEKLQSALPGSMKAFKRNTGSWYVEKFSDDAYYLRYRLFAELELSLPDVVYKAAVKKNAKDVVKSLGQYKRCN